jgi:hypothetical protein
MTDMITDCITGKAYSINMHQCMSLQKVDKTYLNKLIEK